MAYRGSRGNPVSICLVWFVIPLCQCSKLTRLKALDESKGKGQVAQSQQRYGRLLIGQNSLQNSKVNGTNSTENMAGFESDYQADMGWWQTKQLPEQGDWQSSAKEQLLKMQSKVECSRDSMKLLVHDTGPIPPSLIFVDRGQLSPLSLSNLPSSCGYTIRSTQSDLVLVAPYNGCFVNVEGNYHVLPLRWWGLPVRMSCPLMGHVPNNPPMVTCHAEGMVVRTEWLISASNIKVNVNGNWEPLLTVTQRCAFSLVEHPEGIVISVRYTPCLRAQDGLYTLELAADGKTKVSCPSQMDTQVGPIKDAKVPVQQSEAPRKLHPLPTPLPTVTPPPVVTVSQIPIVPQHTKGPQKLDKVPGGVSKIQFPSGITIHPGFQRPVAQPTVKIQEQTPLPYKQSSSKASHFYQLYLSRITRKNPHEEYLPLDLICTQQMQASTSSGFSHSPLHGTAEGKVNQVLYLLCTQLQQKSKHVQPLFLICALPQQSFEPSKGQIYQPFYLLCTQQQKMNIKGTGTELPAQEPPQGHLYQAYFPSYTQLMSPQTATLPPQQPNTQGKVYPPYIPLHTSKPNEKPVTQTPKPVPPQDKVYQQFPFYTPSKPIQKPATPPPQPVAPQDKVYQQFFPFYTPGKPVQKPATPPPQPVTPQDQVHQQFFPFYTPGKPATPPPQLVTPQDQVHQQFFPFYTPGKPATPPPQPVTPQDQVHQQFFPFYTPGKPVQKPATLPPQLVTPQDKVYSQFYPFYTPAKPIQKPGTLPPQPATPQDQVYQQFFPFYTPAKPIQKPATPLPKPITPQSQYKPFFPFYTTAKPMEKPNLPPKAVTPQVQKDQQFPFYTPAKPIQKPDTSPQPVTPQNRLYQQFFPTYSTPRPTTYPHPVTSQDETYQQFNFHNKPYATVPPPEMPQVQVPKQMCLLSQLLVGNQQVNLPTGAIQGKVYGPCQLSRMPGTLKPGPHGQPMYCPNFCPTGPSNCCPQIAFHHHLHLSTGHEGKDAPQVHSSLPFLAPFEDKDLDSVKTPQKLMATAVLGNINVGTSRQLSLQVPEGADDKKDVQPPDGNPASQHKLTDQAAINQFAKDFLYPHWSSLPQTMPHNFEEGKPGSPGDQSMVWYLGTQGKLEEQSGKPNIQLPLKQQPSILFGGVDSKPNFMSYVGQNGHHSTGNQNNPVFEKQPFQKSEYRRSTHHNYKRAIDSFFHPHYMPQDAPVSNNSVALNESLLQLFESGLKNLTKHEVALRSQSKPQNYVLLQHGPPARRSNIQSPVPPKHLAHGAKSKRLHLQQRNPSRSNFEDVQEDDFIWLDSGMSDNLPSNVDHRQLFGKESDLSTFPLVSRHLFPEHTYMKPEGLKSVEDLWNYLTHRGSSDLIQTDVSTGLKSNSAPNQAVMGIAKSEETEDGNQKE